MKSKITSFIVAATALFASCSQEPEAIGAGGDVAAQFTTQITRAAGNSWSANDQIGIFMVKAGTSLAPVNIANNADNVAYKTVSAGVSGQFTPVDPTQTIYFPQSGNVDFISYYPYKVSLTKYIYPIDVSDQSNQEAIDLLYSNNAVAKNSTSPSVAFKFKHRLSKLAIKVSSNGEYTQAQLASMVVRIKGLNTLASFGLANNTITQAQAVADITAKTVTAGASYEAIVLPVAALSGASIEFSIAGKSLLWDLTTPAFVEGNRYNYNLVLGSSGVSVDDSTIDDWEDNTDAERKKIAYTSVDNMSIEYIYNTTGSKKVDQIRIREIDRVTGEIVSSGFSEQINITYTPSKITMQGTIPNTDAIDIYGKGDGRLTFTADYTLNAAGLASSAKIVGESMSGSSECNIAYQYNADNRLVSAIETDALGVKSSECTATWTQGNLMSCVIGSLLDEDQDGDLPAPGVKSTTSTTVWEEYSETYSYYDNLNLNGALYPRTLPSIYYAQTPIGVFASAVGILGSGTKNLVSKLVDTDGTDMEFSYTFQPGDLYLHDVAIYDPSYPQDIEKVTFIFK